MVCTHQLKSRDCQIRGTSKTQPWSKELTLCIGIDRLTVTYVKKDILY